MLTFAFNSILFIVHFGAYTRGKSLHSCPGDGGSGGGGKRDEKWIASSSIWKGKLQSGLNVYHQLKPEIRIIVRFTHTGTLALCTNRLTKRPKYFRYRIDFTGICAIIKEHTSRTLYSARNLGFACAFAFSHFVSVLHGLVALATWQHGVAH